MMNKTKTRHYFFIFIYLLAFYVSTKLNEYVLPFGRHSKLVLYPILFFIGVFIFRKSIIKSFIDFKKNGTKYILFLVGGFILNILLLAVASSFTPDKLSTNHIRVKEAINLFSPFLVIPILGILGPIVEELVFRRIYISEFTNLFPNSNRKIAIWFFMVLSALFFGMHHMHNLSDFNLIAPYIATGIAFGTTYVLTNENLVVVILWHCLNNVIGLTSLAM